MKSNKLILICLFLVILTMGAVGAADDCDNLTADNDAQADIELSADEANIVGESQNISEDDIKVVALDETYACNESDIWVQLPKDTTGNITEYINDEKAKQPYC